MVLSLVFSCQPLWIVAFAVVTKCQCKLLMVVDFFPVNATLGAALTFVNLIVLHLFCWWLSCMCQHWQHNCMASCVTSYMSRVQHWFPNYIYSIMALKCYVIQTLKGYNFDVNLSVRVLTVALGMHQNCVVAQKIGKKAVVPVPKSWEMLCKQFHISLTTITTIIQKYTVHKRAYMSG